MAIIVALSIAVLIGMIGLAVDLGRMFVIKTELQNAADACALAAAKELDGAADSLIRADAAGMLVGGSRNEINFQDEPADAVATLSIAYSATLSGTYNSGASISPSDIPSMDYVKCTISRPNIPILFMVVQGFSSQTVKASAVASLVPSQSPCVLPIGYCKFTPPAVPSAATCPTWAPFNSTTSQCTCLDGSTLDSNGLCVGEWGSGRFDSGGGETGSFNWLQFPDVGNGASDLADLIVKGYCGTIPGTTVAAKEGLADAAEKAWNSRFGLYKPGQGQGNYYPDGNPPAVPDQTGFAYTKTAKGVAAWPTQRNAYADFLLKRQSNTPYQGDNQTGLNNIGNQYKTNQGALDAGTVDRRVVSVPVVDCSGWGSGHTTTLSADFACVLMLHPVGSPGDTVYMEYLGIAGTPGSPCPAFGLPGGGGAEVPGLVQ